MAPRYRAKDKIVVGSRHVKAGEEFESEAEPGKNWFPLDSDATARVVARFGEISDWPANFGLGGADSLFRPRL